MKRPALPAQAAAALDRDERTVVIESDAPAEEQVELGAFADREEAGVLTNPFCSSRNVSWVAVVADHADIGRLIVVQNADFRVLGSVTPAAGPGGRCCAQA